jgi:uncharacterized 2Fe-2S/4Fe-4S cluster protein (DUF4445 family)
MSDKKYRVVFLPENKEVQVEAGASLLEAALTAGAHINASCGGNGVCGTCKVKIVSGSVESDPTEKISDVEFEQGTRLACRSRVTSDLIVEVPLESRLDTAVQARENQQSAGVSAVNWVYSPPIQKYYLELQAATLGDNTSDLSRIRRGLEQQYQITDLLVDFEVIKLIPVVLREKSYKVTVTVLALLDMQGTSSLKISILKQGYPRSPLCIINRYRHNHDLLPASGLERGKILAETIVFNKQISYGSDVITRIAYCQKPDGMQKLQNAVVSSINETINNLSRASGLKSTDIDYVSAAGNTTMEQIILSLDPKYIRLSPYTPTTNFFPLVKPPIWHPG